MRRLLTAALTTLAVLALAAGPAAAANPDPPTVTTGGITDVALTGATLTATVDPGGAATTYRFEYGTSDAYGLVTAERDAGNGTSAVSVSLPVSGLTSDTTYHVRIVATNAAGTARGADRSFTTLAPARAPGVSTSSARSVKATSAQLVGRLDPRGRATSYRFEYGTTSAYGSQTADTSASWTSGSRTVSASIGGLAPYTTYHYRLVATSDAGTSSGSDRTLRTLRAPTSISVGSPAAVLWGNSVTLSGQVLGAGVGGTSVAVQRSDFPFTKGFWVPRVFSAGSDGRFSTTVGPLWETTRLQLVTRSTNVATSPVVTVGVRMRVGVRRGRAGRHGVRLTGVVRPAVALAGVSLQRRTSAGSWVRVRRLSVTPLGGDRWRYRVLAPRARRTSLVRVVVQPGDGGGHLRGVSRMVTVGGALTR